ncbi:Nucleolar protein 9 [Blomia tropicalis]|nr:Nucleolar protein 9 [Blomia tropicalis]
MRKSNNEMVKRRTSSRNRKSKISDESTEANKEEAPIEVMKEENEKDVPTMFSGISNSNKQVEDDREDEEGELIEDDEMTTIDEVKSNNQLIEIKANIDTDDEFHEQEPNDEVDDQCNIEQKSNDKLTQNADKREQKDATNNKSKSKVSKTKSNEQDKDSKESKLKSSSEQSKSTSLSKAKSKSQRSSTASLSTKSIATADSTSKTKRSKSSTSDSKRKNNDDSSISKRKRTTSNSSHTSSDGNYDSEYFKRMSNRSKDGFQDPTDKELFIDNLWRNIKGKEISLTEHKYSTDCLIWFVENCRDNSTLRKITESFSLEKISVAKLIEDSTSEFLESLVEALVRILTEEKKDFDSNTARWVIKYIDGLAKFVCENLLDLLNSSMNGCRIVIMTIEAVGGIQIGRHWSRQNMRFGSGVKVNLQTEIEKDISFTELPSTFKHLLKRFAKSLVLDATDDNIKEILFCRATQVSQYLLFILKVRYPELCQMVVKKLVEVVFTNKTNSETITQSANSAYIIEIIMMVASETRLSKIWTKYLKGNLEPLWKHDIANFIVQRLIDAIRDESLFADVCSEVLPALGEMFKHNRAGIGVCLAKACQGFKKSQHDLINALLKAFDCYEPKEKQLDLVPSMLFIEMKDRFSHGVPKIQIWLHGSLMLQYMMAYSDPYKVSKSLLSLSTDDIIRIAKDRSGSHVIDAFLHSDNIALKYKSEIVERFLGNYHNLSMDKFGSRIVENILTLSDENVKRAIMDELSLHESKLNSNRNGWFVAKKVGLHHFKHRHNDWQQAEMNRDKKKRVFSEFLSGPLGPNRGKGPSGLNHFANNGNRKPGFTPFFKRSRPYIPRG